MWLFDFDGVLMDSARETLVTGYNAVTGRTATDLASIPEPVAERFIANRCHALNSTDLYQLMAWLLTAPADMHVRPMPMALWEKIRTNAALPPAERSRRFFTARRRFMDADFEAWLDLHRPFQPLWNHLSQKADAPVLLTSKNREACLALCRHFGMSIPEENIYSGDNGMGKPENFKAIHERFRQPRYRFLDDAIANLRNLDAAANTSSARRIIPMLAAWGYLGPNDAKTAADLGFPVVDMQEIIANISE